MHGPILPLNAFTSGLPWLVALAMPEPSDRVLDVAGGTGMVARALAPSVTSFTVLDATGAMLEAGRESAAIERLRDESHVSMPADGQVRTRLEARGCSPASRKGTASGMIAPSKAVDDANADTTAPT